MDRLLPSPGPESLDDLYADLDLTPTSSGSRVVLMLVTSLDGAATGPDGRSGSLGGRADTLALARLRDAADVILVGSATVKLEDYGPVGAADERLARRRAAGLTDTPAMAVVTGRGHIDPSARFLEAPDRRVLVVTTSAGADRLQDRLPSHVELIIAGEGDAVDLDDAIRQLHDLGLVRVVCEGGPTLAASLLAAGLVDELFITVAAVLVGPDGVRVMGSALPDEIRLELAEARRDGSDLLLRYVVRDR